MEPTLWTRTLGDVISDTWRIYKDNFWEIFKISAIVQGPAIILIFILFLLVAGVAFMSGFFDPAGVSEFAVAGLIAIIVPIYVLFVVGFLVIYIVLEGAVTHAVCQLYVGQEIEISAAFRQTFRRFWPMLGAITLLLLAVFLMAITIVGIPFAVYFGLRWYFALQAVLLEGASPMEALRGSSELVEGSWWRVLGITIVVALVILAVSIIPSIVLAFIPIIGSLFVNILVSPAYAIAKTVLYCDLRTRVEGPEQFNEDVLARDIGLGPVDEEGWSKFNPA